ncbi:hypothetical protein IU429_29310 [Nocardia elegans]|uniref:Uncharacterized protein n=1 Tax=Nocardia elegans TaxID=300029 RepID=A0ABW6TL08_9NOCA|nr:hypothetical protein [Nocardia elegans]MBF6451767.1 hypothetical protein [Nocardia elegans]
MTTLLSRDRAAATGQLPLLHHAMGRNPLVPGLTAVVAINLDRSHSDGIRLTGWVSIVSPTVAQVVASLPAEARQTFLSLGDEYGEIDSCKFDLGQEAAYAPAFGMWDAGDITGGVQWVMKYVDGPMAAWLAKRGTLPALLETAREPATVSWETNPDPTLLRGVVVLCALVGRAHEAATLMQWYLQRDTLHRWDSREDASLWDAALRERFPDYAAARVAG